MNQNNIKVIESDVNNSEKQNANNQQHPHNILLQLQHQKQNEDKKQSFNIAEGWDFFQQYYQFFNTPESNLKLNKMLRRQENKKSSLKSTTSFDLKEIFLNNDMIQKLVQILQAKIIINGFQIIIDDTKNENQYSQQIDINISLINNTKTFEITDLFCKYGRYAKKYTVLNIFQKSFRHSLPIIGMGGMSEIYLNQCFQEQQHYCALKCIKVNNESVSQFKSIVRQFFITDLLSSLQIAPKIIKNTGFDFIVFDKCIEFQMQVCESFKVNSIELDLKQNLLFMHLLKIVHNDIKRNNMKYSPLFQKNVFIDFGISDHLHQSFGKKTWTNFKGTYQFCSEQMQSIVCGQKQKMIDLYKNDVIMLKKSFSTLKPRLKQSLADQNHNKYLKEQYFQVTQNKQNIFYLEKKTKFYFYTSKSKLKLNSKLIQIFHLAKRLKDKDNLKNYIQSIFEFVSNFKIELISLLLEEKLFKSNEQILNLLGQFAQQSMYSSESEQNRSRLNYLIKIKVERANFFHNIKSKISKKSKNIYLSMLKNKVESLIVNYQNNIKIENIQFILLNIKQIRKLKRQDYFELFINYSSIWFRNYKETSMSKILKASQVFRQVVMQDQIQKSFQYLNEAYFPDDTYIRTQYSDLVWAYGYLLSYCFFEQTNEFKAKYILVIAKQTILLNFKYCLYLNQAFMLYAKYLIKHKVPIIFSLITLHKCQMTWLVYVHYSYIISPIQQLKQIKTIPQQLKDVNKFCLRPIRDSIKQGDKIISNQNQSKDQLKYKQKFLLAISGQEIQIYYLEDFIQYKQLILQIDNQICQLQKLHSIEINDGYYEYLLTIMNHCYAQYYQKQIIKKDELKFKTKLVKIYNNLAKEGINFPQSLFQKFTQADKFSTQLNLEKFLTKLDSKINQNEISKYFFIDLRLQLCITQKNKHQFAKLMLILSMKSTFLYLNQQMINEYALDLPIFKIKDILDNQEIIKQQKQIIALRDQQSFQNSINQLIQQKYEDFFKNIINVYILTLYQELKQFNKIGIIDESKNICRIFQAFQQNLQQSCIISFKDLIKQKLSKQIQQSIRKSKDKKSSQQLMLLYNLYRLKKIYTQKQKGFIQNLDFIQTQKQLFKCLHLVCQNLPLIQKEQFVSTDTSSIRQPFFIQITYHDRSNYFLYNKLKLGWQNYKLRSLLLSNVEIIQNLFLSLWLIFSSFKLYDILSQIILVQAYVLWNNKSGMLLNIFNYQVKSLQFTQEREVTFCTELINKITKLTNNNFDQTYLFTIFIHILHYQHYLSQNRAVWKKILYFVCKNFQKFPYLSNQEKNIKLKRKEQIMLRSLIFQQKETKYRKKMIMTRKWVKILQDQSPFQRKQTSDYVVLYLKKIKKHYKISDSSLIKKLFNKEREVIINILFDKNISFSSNSQAQLFIFEFHSSLFKQSIIKKIQPSTKSLKDAPIYQNKQKIQQATLEYQYLFKFCQKYDLINIQIFNSSSANNYEFMQTYRYLLLLEQKLKDLSNQIFHFKQNNTKQYRKKEAQLQNIREKYLEKEKQLQQKVYFIKESQYYKSLEQIAKIQSKILNQENKKLIKELVKQKKLQYNKKKGKYQTIRFHKYLEIKFQKNDTLDQCEY